MATCVHPERRQFLVAASVALAAAAVARSASAAGAVLPAPQSLADELQRALANANPLVVMVSLDGCPFCKVTREHYLVPLREQIGLHVVQVDMNSDAALQIFDGTVTTHAQQVRAWGIKLAPTVLFFGHSGAEVAPRLEGAGAADFYGAYLDARLERARDAIRHK